MKRSGLLRRGLIQRRQPLGYGTSTLARGKPMRTGRSTDKPTAAQSRRMGMVKRLGCICCRINRQTGLPTAFFGPCEAHHLLSGGKRRGHDETIGLCPWHHRAVRPQETIGTDITIHTFGPSVATSTKAFHAMYGSDDELLEFQNALLEIADGYV